MSALLIVAVGGTYAAWRMGVQEDLPRLAAPQELNSDDTKTNESALRTTSEGIDGRSADLAKRIQPKTETVVIWNPVTQGPVGTSTITSATIDVGQPSAEAPAEPASTSPPPAPEETATPQE